MEKNLLFIGKSILVLFLGVFVGTFLLVVAYKFPVHTTNKNTAYELEPRGGEYPRVSELGSDYVYNFSSFFPDVLDGGSDAVILRTALDESGGNALVRAMASHSNYMGDYCYYWHGYVSVLRPLMRVFSLSELRIFNFIAQFLIVFLCGYVIGKNKGIRYCIMFLCSYIMLMPLAIMMSLQYSWVFYIAYFGMFILILKQDFFSKGNRYIFFFILLGICTSYFDLLTYPLITWGVPLIWWLVVDEEYHKPIEWVKKVIYSGCGWIFGYAGMWIMKWILASFVLGYNVLEAAINEVFLRSGTLADDAYGITDRLNAIYVNWRHYEYILFILIIFIWVGWWLWQTMKKGKWKYCNKKYAYCLIGLSSIVWYIVLANHTTIHHIFTYRILNITLLAVMALMLESVPRTEQRNRKSIKNICIKAGTAVGVLILSVLLAYAAREELYTTNGEADFYMVELHEGDYIEFSFSPEYNQITELGIGLQSESKEGEYLITLWEGEEQIQKEFYSIEESNGSNYWDINVSWNLNHNKIYYVTIEVFGNREPVFAWVTQNGNMVLPECSDLKMNEAKTEGQLLTGITYLSYPKSIVRLFSLTVSWFCVICIAIYVIQGKKDQIIDELN